MSRTGPYEDSWQTPDFSGPRYSQSLARGLAIMECFTAERPALGIAEIADELGMSRSTTHRYLTTLVALGYMEQDKSRKYRLSLRVSDLGMAALNSTGVREHAHAILEELRQRSKLTASLAVLDGQEIVYVDRVASFQRGREDVNKVVIGIGSRLPPYCTAMGKVLLAHLPEDERKELLSHALLERHGPNTITSKGALQDELNRALQDGFATEDEECKRGRIAIAAPIRNESREVVGAIDVSTHTSTIAVEQLADGLRPHLIAAADRISARLGYRREDEITAR
jgi:IclR family transcriptional regulator, pca regulon regulatory protein